jgi:tetratricopeptide (TPR) repeat protein
VEAELASLLATGATTLTGAIVTDAWATLKDRLGTLLGRAQQPEPAGLDELEQLRGRLTAARDRGDETGAAEVESRITALLHSRLRQLLIEQPSLAGEVRELVNACGPTVTHRTLVTGAQAQVSNTYHYYGNPPIPQPVAHSRRSPLPRITLQPMRHYQNNDELLQRMDTIWSACRADGTPALMYLTGVPGIGTSAIVRRWLHRHRDALTGPQLHARLGRDTAGNLPDPAAILERWFRELGVPRQDVPADPQDRSGYFRTVVSNGPIVVLLEDVVLASQVKHLLPGTAGSVVFVTSHALLPALVGTFGAETLAMGPLGPVHSRNLLTGLAGFDTDTAARMEELDLIAAGCQGLPLALCVAGAQLAVGHPGTARALAAELSQRRTRLGALDVDGDLSVTAALGPGYRNLSETAARVYRSLGLHPTGDFEADVVGAVLPDLDGAARSRALRELTAANLIEPATETGYRMRHTLIHDHALACANSDEPAQTRDGLLDRIIDHYAEIAERAEAALSSRYRHDPTGAYARYTPTGPVDGAAVVAGLERRREVLRQAVRLAHDTGRHAMAWRMAQALHTFHLRGGLHSDWIATHELACRSALETGDLLALARMHFELGFARLDRWSTAEGDPQAAREQFERALELVRPASRPATQEQRRTESSVLEGLGLAMRKLGRPARALECYDSALEALEGIDHPRGRALLALHRGPAYTDLGQHDQAAQELRSARAQFAALPVPDRYNQARALTRFAEDRRAAGRHDEALRALDEAIDLMTGSGPPYQHAAIMLLHGDLLHECGRRDQALESWTAAGALFQQANSLRSEEAEARIAAARQDTNDPR